ncbi:MAG TPA: helix-turn-helix transcriptional regulator [Puia sp.]|nr:helix-turn-helix transcriptional regulator [Puia sp.]
MSTHTSHKDIKTSFEDLFKPREKSVEEKHDSLMLMAAFLSEIERVQDEKKMSRKDLAEKIDITPSYLTQVFRSKKPLNFLTLAKIKRELDILFEIKAVPRAKSLPVSYTVQNSPQDSGMYLIEGGQFYKFKQAIPA